MMAIKQLVSDQHTSKLRDNLPSLNQVQTADRRNSDHRRNAEEPKDSQVGFEEDGVQKVGE